jgi:hypothetical protein
MLFKERTSLQRLKIVCLHLWSILGENASVLSGVSFIRTLMPFMRAGDINSSQMSHHLIPSLVLGFQHRIFGVKKHSEQNI